MNFLMKNVKGKTSNEPAQTYIRNMAYVDGAFIFMRLYMLFCSTDVAQPLIYCIFLSRSDSGNYSYSLPLGTGEAHI